MNFLLNVNVSSSKEFCNPPPPPIFGNLVVVSVQLGRGDIPGSPFESVVEAGEIDVVSVLLNLHMRPQMISRRQL